MGTTTFNAMEIDAIGEIMNISIGASATAVSTMLGTTTNITTPIVSVETRSQFSFKDLEPAIGVEISYVKGLSGRNVMMFSRDDVRVIVGMMMGQEIPPEEFEMDELNASAIREVMNMMMGSSATALSEFLGYAVDISTPVSFEIKNAEDFKNKYFPNDEPQVVVRFSLEIGDKLSSEFLNIMGIDLAKKLLEPYADSLGMGSDDAGQTADAAAQANASAGTADAGAAADTAAQAAAKPNAAAQAAPDQTAEQNAAAQDQTPGAAEAQSMPAGNQADTAAASSGSGEKLDQAATDALLASLKAQNSAGGTADSQSAAMNDDKYGQPEQNISDEDAKAQYEAMTKGQRPLSQGETDALLASLKQQAASDTASQTAPQAGNTESAAQPATQMGNTQSAGQPASQMAESAGRAAQSQGGYTQPGYANPAGQTAAQPQNGYAQPPYGGQPYPQPYYAPQPDPALAQILQTMQQSQAQMVQMMQQMNEDRKEERREFEAREKERIEEEKREEESQKARKEKEKKAEQLKPNIYRSLHSPEYADVPETDEINDENRDMLMKVPLEISVEIGRTMKPIKDILELTQGSLVVLDKMAGEQADLYVNGECIARGDVVVVEDNFGIRITEILSKGLYREEL